MSTPHLRDNGWYCDCLPSGAFVRLVRDTHLETQHGTVPLPNGQNLLFVTLHLHNGMAWVWKKLAEGMLGGRLTGETGAAA